MGLILLDFGLTDPYCSIRYAFWIAWLKMKGTYLYLCANAVQASQGFAIL